MLSFTVVVALVVVVVVVSDRFRNLRPRRRLPVYAFMYSTCATTSCLTFITICH